MTVPSATVHEASSKTITNRALRLQAGDLVEVRSADEIRRTLDSRGELDALPFMPEMVAYCGTQFRVYRRADKTCDTIQSYQSRRMRDTVHLDGLRCDGSKHDGCQAACLVFWKEAWLKRVREGDGADASVLRPAGSVEQGEQACERHAFEERLCAATRTSDGAGIRYSCQATELVRASDPLQWWDVRQYVREVTSRNVSIFRLLRGGAFALYSMIRRRVTRNGLYPYHGGVQTRTPTERLNLQPGELVQVRSRKEIYATLDEARKNRGLTYDPEMWRFSGKVFRVLRRVDRIINDKTGRMISIPNPCVILEGAVCWGECSRNRMFCPRSIYPYWREIWLRRVPEQAGK